MSSSLKVLAIVGSLRSGSVNAAVARAAQRFAPSDMSIDMYGVADLPLYNGDEEDAGPPAAAVALHDAVSASDAILLFSPEYNSSFSAVTKNVIDWLSRPPKAWEGMPIGLVSAAPGSRAGQGLRDHFDTVMEHLPVRAFYTHGIGKSFEKIGDGELVDESAASELAEYLLRFDEFCRAPSE